MLVEAVLELLHLLQVQFFPLALSAQFVQEFLVAVGKGLLLAAHFVFALVEELEGLGVGVDGDEGVGVLRIFLLDLGVVLRLVLDLAASEHLPALGVDVADDEDGEGDEHQDGGYDAEEEAPLGGVD